MVNYTAVAYPLGVYDIAFYNILNFVDSTYILLKLFKQAITRYIRRNAINSNKCLIKCIVRLNSTSKIYPIIETRLMLLCVIYYDKRFLRQRHVRQY